MAEESGDSEFKSSLDAASLQKAKDELNERNDKDRLLAVQTFRKWVLEQDWLKSPTDFAFLLRFLRAKKFSQLEARKKLENYWKARSARPEWFLGGDPFDPIVLRGIREGMFVCSPKKDKQNRRLLIGRVGQFNMDMIKEMGIDNFYKSIMLLYDWIVYEENAQTNGLVFISDYTGMTMQLFTTFFNREAQHDFMSYFQNGLPARIKSINAYNEPAFFDFIFSIISPMMSKKIKERFHIHGRSLVNIYKDVGYECLPDEYLPDDYEGPSAGSIDDFKDWIITEIQKPAFVDHVKDIRSGKYGVDKSRIPQKPTETASYRKLNVD